MTDILGTTYKKVFQDWKREEEATGSLPLTAFTGAERFAAWLDRFNTITPELQVLALTQGRKVDQECISALIDELGTDKAAPIIQRIAAKYKVKKHG